MARLVQSNIRTLEGALVKLVAYASLVNSPVTTQLAADILERYYISAGIGAASPEESAERRALINKHITPELIQKVVASKFGLSVETLTSKRRDRETSHARQVAMHLARELTELSLPQIGQGFGGRDHTTVMHACERIKSKLPMDESLRSVLEDLIAQIRAQAGGEG
jgi:chromosomal replication initiator protein